MTWNYVIRQRRRQDFVTGGSEVWVYRGRAVERGSGGKLPRAPRQRRGPVIPQNELFYRHLGWKQKLIIQILIFLDCATTFRLQVSFAPWASFPGPQSGSQRACIGGLEYEVPQSRLYCLCINVAICSTALQCICRVIRRSSITMTAHTYYIIFGRPPIGGSSPPSGATVIRE